MANNKRPENTNGTTVNVMSQLQNMNNESTDLPYDDNERIKKQAQKKIEQKKFEEDVNFMALLESIKLYDIICLYLQKEREKKLEELEVLSKKIDSSGEYIIDYDTVPAMPTAKKEIPTEERSQIEKMRDQILQFIKTIDLYIEKVDAEISVQQKAIDHLKNKDYQDFQKFISSWDCVIT